MDSRFPERWLHDRRVRRLTDAGFRTFVNATTWSVSNRTDGEIEHDDLSLVPGASVAHAEALVNAGLWETTPTGWLITVWDDTQTSREKLEALDARRRNERDRQARHRAKQPAEDPAVTGQSRDSPNVTKHVTSKARTGKARTGSKSEPPTEAEWDDVTVTPPGSGRPLRRSQGSDGTADPLLEKAGETSASPAPDAHHTRDSEIP